MRVNLGTHCIYLSCISQMLTVRIHTTEQEPCNRIEVIIREKGLHSYINTLSKPDKPGFNFLKILKIFLKIY